MFSFLGYYIYEKIYVPYNLNKQFYEMGKKQLLQEVPSFPVAMSAMKPLQLIKIIVNTENNKNKRKKALNYLKLTNYIVYEKVNKRYFK